MKCVTNHSPNTIATVCSATACSSACRGSRKVFAATHTMETSSLQCLQRDLYQAGVGQSMTQRQIATRPISFMCSVHASIGL